jgi:outer membrane protein TolC
MVRMTVFVSALSVLTVLCAIPCRAQTPLTLQDAVDRALESRASLKADRERIAGAEGATQQAGAFPNPEVSFQNENLRPGQDYGDDVGTLPYVVQPLNILGKRDRRVAAAEQGVVRTRAEFEEARWQVVRDVQMVYWAARGTQAIRDLLRDTVGTFRQILQYHEAQLSVGAIAEQNVLRVRLESERLDVNANLASVRASRADFTTVHGPGVVARAGTAEVLQTLRGSGVSRLVMLTGDNDESAQQVARGLGIDEVRSRLLPEDKVRAGQHSSTSDQRSWCS